ncbi:hypothetical protein M406DRAFT_354896 [Cryphonectria parasitica EP155]|uniref:Uncharacterized protein n=1 Tax=Cryphonectria parasitica (strain ATCC 38755 / EP155) TaxID=660469 RepID=A0A9P5CRD2_CRYP1|nr:uncharacterized protein M406DRAFT_354896 [Cryphonectria parasitica EP155]KAF3768439.1 hypothetical protein M406DRAFT_354896 [Cryphonectria parasitica EP155]
MSAIEGISDFSDGGGSGLEEARAVEEVMFQLRSDHVLRPRQGGCRDGAINGKDPTADERTSGDEDSASDSDSDQSMTDDEDSAADDGSSEDGNGRLGPPATSHDMASSFTYDTRAFQPELIVP